MNEINGVKKLVPMIDKTKFYEVICIDGNSTDGTQEELRKQKIPYFVQKLKGLGGAVIEARKQAKGDAILFFHPDGNCDISDLDTFIKYFDMGHEFIVASRNIKGASNEEDMQLLKSRKWAGLLMAFLDNLLFGTKYGRCTDPMNGYRGITKAAFNKMKLTVTDASVDQQMIIRSKKNGVSLVEFPTKEGNRIGGETKFHFFDTGYTHGKLLLREFLFR
tara:strand:+ start:809 stop:1465 length:657 start_codon:yes stop_codon:yes gene_type:complete